jgi:hypothetical protein
MTGPLWKIQKTGTGIGNKPGKRLPRRITAQDDGRWKAAASRDQPPGTTDDVVMRSNPTGDSKDFPFRTAIIKANS